jgi:hypothetical protein
MRYGILVILGLLLVSPAQAGDKDVFFQNYVGVTKLLRARGVEPVGVNWGAIQAMCLGLKIEKDPVPYNRCLYEKALDYADYDNDNDTCNARARAEYPDRLLSGAATIRITRDNEETNVYERALSLDELRFKRLGAFDACMSNKGWRDAQSPARGRRDYETE